MVSSVKWRLFERVSTNGPSRPALHWHGADRSCESSTHDVPTESDLADWEGDGGSFAEESRDIGEAVKEPPSGL
jgi:hypothetical protein